MVNILLKASIVNLPLSLDLWSSESRRSIPLLHLYGLTQGLTLQLRLMGEAFSVSLRDSHSDPFTFIFSIAFS